MNDFGMKVQILDGLSDIRGFFHSIFTLSYIHSLKSELFH